MRARIWILAGCVLAGAHGALGAPQGESLLPVYAIVDDSVQLQSERRDVSTYEDVEYSRNVRNCARDVERGVDAWLKAKRKVASRRRARESRVRFEIEVARPRRGTLVIDYAWVKPKMRASLDLRFLSPRRLTQAEREQLVFGLELVDLRDALAASMKCS